MTVKNLVELLNTIDLEKDGDAIVALTLDFLDIDNSILTQGLFDTQIKSEYITFKDGKPNITINETNGIKLLEFDKNDGILVRKKDLSEKDRFLSTYRYNLLINSKSMITDLFSENANLEKMGFRYAKTNPLNPTKDEGYKFFDEDESGNRRVNIAIEDIKGKLLYNFRALLIKSKDEVVLSNVECKLLNNSYDWDKENI